MLLEGLNELIYVNHLKQCLLYKCHYIIIIVGVSSSVGSGQAAARDLIVTGWSGMPAIS